MRLERAEDAQGKFLPQLITDVQTTLANVQDVEITHVIQEDLAQHHLLPDEQIVVTSYIDALVVGEQPTELWDHIARSGPLGQQRAGPKQARVLM